MNGWWYYEPGADHFDDWVTHCLPHLLVLHDLESRQSYWVHITAGAVQSTGEGAKILVPATQTVDEPHAPDLMAVAASQAPTISLEGSAWTPGGISPARRLRHALLVPRLMAPHRNAGFRTPIGPEEAIALLVQGRIGDFERFAKEHTVIPTLSEALSSTDWRWQFAGALGHLLVKDDPTPAISLMDTAARPEHRAIARVLAACVHMDAERHEDAAAVLSAGLEDASPVDWAWGRVQRARARAEIGDVATAREDAVAAQRALIGDTDDVTSSAIGAAAASLLFETAAWGEEKLQDVIVASDTAVSWWRHQTLSAGLTELATRTFRQWANDQSERWVSEDVLNNRLFAASVNAHFTGEHGVRQAMGSLLAQNSLVEAHADNDTPSQTQALQSLRRNGDHKSLKLAVDYLWAGGPLGPVTHVVHDIHPGGWTHTNALPHLTLWHRAGDLLRENPAQAAVHYCLELLTDHSSFAARTTPRFLIPIYVLDALSGVLRATDDKCHREVARFLTELPPIKDSAFAQHLSRVVTQLRPGALAPPYAPTALRETASTQADRILSRAILGVLASHDEQARMTLTAWAANGDADAAGELGDVRLLHPDTVRELATRAGHTLETTIEQAKNGSFTIGGRNLARSIALWGAWFPKAVPWKTLIRFLRHEQIPGEYKRDACFTLAAHAARLPDAVRSELRDLSLQLPGKNLSILLGQPLGGAAVVLAAAVGGLNEHTIAASITQLLVESRRTRADAAILIARAGRPEHLGILIPLLSDTRPEVRSAAAHALATWAANPAGRNEVLVHAGLQQALDDQGARVPLVIANTITDLETPPQDAQAILAPLLDHPSAFVREKANRSFRTN